MTVLPFVQPADRTAAFPRVAEHMRAGGLLAYPTETVYGVGSRAVTTDIAALSALKGRPEGKPFLLLVSSRAMAERAGLFFSPGATVLADACWPGPLTLILPGGGRLPDSLRGSEGGIAVRWTAHKGVADLVAYLDEPVTSTSANRPGGPPAPGVGAIQEVFASAIAAGQLLILDGGVLGNVPPSTIVDCTGTKTRLVREGALPRAELQARVGRLAP